MKRRISNKDSDVLLYNCLGYAKNTLKYFINDFQELKFSGLLVN